MTVKQVVIAPAISEDEGLVPAPIRPGWILDGQPRARAKALASSRDGLSRSALWDCTAGRFEWHFGADETVHILQGEVIVTCPTGTTTTLRTGDVAYFPAGISSVWHVPVYVKKLAILRAKRTLRTVGRSTAKRVLKPLLSGRVARSGF